MATCSSPTPVAARSGPDVSRQEYADRYGLDTEKLWIALLPGSRQKEVKANLPEMLRTAVWLQDSEPEKYEFVIPLASTVDTADVRDLKDRSDESFAARNQITPIVLVPDARLALYHARAAIVASGTATVLAALMGRPFIVVYKVSALSYAIAKRAIRYPAEIPAPLDAAGNPPVAMVNLIAGRRIVPELLQHRFTPENAAVALQPLLAETPERTAMIAALAEVRTLLHPTGPPAIERAASAVLNLLRP